MGATPIYALPYPELADPADANKGFHDLALATEGVLSNLSSSLIGTYAARPAATAVGAGTLYFATDARGVWRSDHTVWVLVQQDAPRITPAQFTGAPWSTPYDGMMVQLLVDASAGIVWTLVYRAASASAYKWECVGGPPLMSEVLTQEILPPDTISAYRPLATWGPVVTLPFGGDYLITAFLLGTIAYQLNSGAGSITRMSYATGNASQVAALDADAAQVGGIGNMTSDYQRTRLKTCSIGAVTAFYSHDAIGNGGGGIFWNRQLIAQPVRLGQS